MIKFTQFLNVFEKYLKLFFKDWVHSSVDMKLHYGDYFSSDIELLLRKHRNIHSRELKLQNRMNKRQRQQLLVKLGQCISLVVVLLAL